MPPLVEPDHPLEDQEGLRRLARWCQRFSPSVSVEETDRPECLFLDITGCVHLFGGEEGMARRVTQELSEQGYIVSVAIADTVGAAWGLARYSPRAIPLVSSSMSERSASRWLVAPALETRHALAELPIQALRCSEEVVLLLRELGVERISDLASLPRHGLASRFGPDLLRRFSQAVGEVREILIPCRPIPCLEESLAFEYPIDHSGILDNIFRQLLEGVLRRLDGSQGAVELLVRCMRESGPPVEMRLGVCRPTVSPRHWLELLRLRLERRSLPGPVTGLLVRVTGTAPMEWRQQDLFEAGSDQEHRREFEHLLNRLSSRLGRDAVLVSRSVPDPQPEYAYRYVPVLEGLWSTSTFQISLPRSVPSKGHPTGTPRTRKARADARRHAWTPGMLHRPLWLKVTPLPIHVLAVAPAGPPQELQYHGGRERVRQAWGPERIETGWWRGKPIRRDYYQVETDSGARLWLFRDRTNGRWFLHGVF